MEVSKIGMLAKSKAGHDLGKIYVIVNEDEEYVYLCDGKIRTLEKLKKKNYALNWLEYHYKYIKPVIMCEEFLDEGTGNRPIDYKFMCFNGKVEYLFLDVGVIDNQSGGHAHEYYRNIYSKEFELLDVIETRSNTPYEIKKPKNYDKMVSIAEKLSAGLKHVRVDLYNVDGKIYFGEMTFYHGSGYNNFFPKEYEKILGDLIHIETRK